MRRLIAHCICFLCILASSLLWGGADITHLLITEENNATPILEKLLELDDIQVKNLADIVIKTQAKWIAVRQGANGLERRDIVDGPHEREIAAQVHEICERLGLFSPQVPEKKHYDYGVCLGAFYETTKRRLEGLLALRHSGVHFDTLVLLGGERTLRESERERLPATCETEYDMLVELSRGIEGPVVVVNAPRGEASRPSTADTYRAWLEQCHPAPGSVLAMSTIGLTSYQHLVGKNCLGDDFVLETVCPEDKMDHVPTVRIAFDTVAKCLNELLRSRS